MNAEFVECLNILSDLQKDAKETNKLYFSHSENDLTVYTDTGESKVSSKKYKFDGTFFEEVVPEDQTGSLWDELAMVFKLQYVEDAMFFGEAPRLPFYFIVVVGKGGKAILGFYGKHDSMIDFAMPIENAEFVEFVLKSKKRVKDFATDDVYYKIVETYPEIKNKLES